MRIIGTLIFLIISSVCIGQLTDTTGANSNLSEVELIYETYECDKKPVFPGGEAGLPMFIAQNTSYPELAKKKNIQGDVYLKFVVTKAGEIGEIKIEKSVDPILDNEAIRVVKSLPKWNPAIKKGNPVNSWARVSVKFRS